MNTCYANIIMLVPTVDKFLQERAFEVGINDIVPMNFEDQDLLSRVGKLLHAV